MLQITMTLIVNIRIKNNCTNKKTEDTGRIGPKCGRGYLKQRDRRRVGRSAVRMGAEIHRRSRRTRRMVKSQGPRTRDDKEQAISTRRTVISLRFHTSTRFIPRLSCQQEVGAALPERVQYLIVQNKGLQGQLSEVKRKQAESDCKSKEEAIAVRLREAGSMAAMAELQQKIAELEIRKEEGQIQGQLNHSDASQYITQLQERISELKNEQIISEAHDRLQPPVEEDWEEEVKQSLPRTEDCENQSKDSSPYEPEDVVKPDDLKECPDHMQYQNLTHMEYIPALHHVSPVKWVSCVNRVVSGQFLDAEE